MTTVGVELRKFKPKEICDRKIYKCVLFGIIGSSFVCLIVFSILTQDGDRKKTLYAIDRLISFSEAILVTLYFIVITFLFFRAAKRY